jgi:hypothetical protein
MQQPGQWSGIAGIGLDPIPGRSLQLRRRSDQTQHPGGQQEPAQPETGRAASYVTATMPGNDRNQSRISP